MLTVVVVTETANLDYDGDAVRFLVSYVAPFVAILFVSYVCCRLSPIFPSIAVDEPLAVRSAWQMTQGNGWRLLTMLMIFPIAVKVIHTNYISYVYTNEAVPMPLLTVFWVLVILITYVLATVGVITLSLAYAELKKTGSTVDG